MDGRFDDPAHVDRARPSGSDLMDDRNQCEPWDVRTPQDVPQRTCEMPPATGGRRAVRAPSTRRSLLARRFPGSATVVRADPAERTGRRRFGRVVVAIAALIGGAALVGLTFGLLAAPSAAATGLVAIRAVDIWEAQRVDVPFDAALPHRSIMVDRNGTQFATLYSEDRVPLTREQISPHFVDALIATEDSRFFQHGGVDVVGTGRALFNNAIGGRRQGASTITQQWVKNLVQAAADTEEKRAAADDVSVARKLGEARAAVEAERRFSKDEILTRYTNTAFYGNGAYGLGAAAARYFSTSADQLTVPQAATLAGVLNAPGVFDPISRPESALKRRNQVLDRMVTEGMITPEAAAAAKAEPLGLSPSIPPNGCAASTYPIYCQWVRESIASDPEFAPTPAARSELLYRGGLVIRTSLDPRVQANADAAVQAAFEPTNRVAAAAAVVQPGSGQVLALASSRPWGANEAAGQSEILYPVAQAFQPGSTFKPITLAAAIEQGFDTGTVWNAPARYTPSTLNAPEGGFTNAGDGPGGTMNAEQATWRSVNTYFVKLIEQTGVMPVADMARRLGMTSIRTEGQGSVGARDAALTLGDFNTSPLQVANVYATFAAGGVACDPVGVTSMVRDGVENLPVATGDCRQAVDPAVAAKVNTILQGTIDGTDPARTGAAMSIGRPATGKTGTAGEFAAAWFAGATPQMATAVWVGDPRGGPGNPLREVTAFGEFYEEVYGGKVPGPIWKQIMSTSLADQPVMNFPGPTAAALPAAAVPNVVGMPLDAAVGTLSEVGLTVEIAHETAAAAQPMPPGYVVAMSPAAGTQRRLGAPVVLALSPGSRTDVVIRQGAG